MKLMLFAILSLFATSTLGAVAATHKASHTEYVEARAQAKADLTDARKACVKRAGKVRNDCLIAATAANRKAVADAKAKHSAALAAGH